MNFSNRPMPWIDQIDEEKATGRLREIYEDIEKRRGKISNIMRVHSLSPDAMMAHMNLYIAILFKKSPLRREDRELIAVIVSAINNCPYCIKHHAEALLSYWKNIDRLNQVLDDFHQVDFPRKTTAMISYVEKLTKTPYEITKSDIDILKDMGFSDKTILE